MTLGTPRAATGPLLDRLLESSSRTFALTIPLLPEPTRREVTVAYLLFRVADTLEDSTRWNRERKIEELEAFSAFLDDAAPREAAGFVARWGDDPPHDHEGYRDLLEHFEDVAAALVALSDEARAAVVKHTRRTAAGMVGFVRREDDGRLTLESMADLEAYCYAVAGIVGELLTELFLLGEPRLGDVADRLRADAASFGEALQLVNILKDSDADAAEGRRYLPASVPREAVFARADDDLRAAARYVRALGDGGAPPGVLAFNALPALLARQTLDRVRDEGPGAKIGRTAVAATVARLGVARGRGTIPELLERMVYAERTEGRP